MPYTKKNYPNTMKNLSSDVREKAIEILNTLLEEKKMDESIAIPTSISRAKDWASNRGKPISKTETDQKSHGKDLYVLPQDDGWAIKKENASKASFVFETKKEAVDKARDMA